MQIIKKEKSDRRIKKSRQSIQQALLRLMKEKPFEKITVSELAEAADINRKTFYNHYESVQAVRQEIDEEFIEIILSMFVGIDDKNIDPVRFVKQFIRKLVTILEEDKTSAKFLFETGEVNLLTKQLKEILQPIIFGSAAEHGLNPSVALLYCGYIAGGLISVVKTWVCSGYEAEASDIEVILTELVLANIPEEIKKLS